MIEFLFQCVLFLPDFSPEMNPLNSYGQCFADNELHNIKGYTEDQKNKVLAMATVTINTTTQKPDNMQISWNLFL